MARNLSITVYTLKVNLIATEVEIEAADWEVSPGSEFALGLIIANTHHVTKTHYVTVRRHRGSQWRYSTSLLWPMTGHVFCGNSL